MSDENFMTRFTRGAPGRTILKLVIISIVLGAFFSMLGTGPLEFWRGVFDFFKNLISSLGESFGEIAMTLGTYLVIGAGIVIPIWLIARLLSTRK